MITEPFRIPESRDLYEAAIISKQRVERKKEPGKPFSEYIRPLWRALTYSILLEYVLWCAVATIAGLAAAGQFVDYGVSYLWGLGGVLLLFLVVLPVRVKRQGTLGLLITPAAVAGIGLLLGSVAVKYGRARGYL